MAAPEMLTTYTDALGAPRESPEWAVAHVRNVLGEPRTGPFADVIRVRAGDRADALRGRTIETEDGGSAVIGDVIPADLPLGYHRLADTDAGPVRVLHAPPRVPAPKGERGWVIVAQLYAARSRRSWGHGDLGDARALHDWVSAGGPGGHLMLNPLHAAIPGPDPQPSPYFASSRVFRNPLYLCVEELPGADRVDLSGWRAAAQALDAARRIDRTAAWAQKRAALAAVWQIVHADPGVATAVDRWLADPINADYARFCVVTEAAGGTAPTATAQDLRAAGPATATDEERFHAWLQVAIAEQLFTVGDGLVHDVAVGTDRGGADAWLWPECFVLDGTRIGCPPDQFNTLGQDWGLPPFHPAGLRAAGLEPWIRAVRTAVAGAAGIRLDHVMGLERLFWIPEEGRPPDGVYVQYPLQEMLDVVAIEADRAGAFVVGEDLGTVPPSIPTALAERGMLSYRIASLDADHPSSFPVESMAAITTHDLATTIGLLSGSDLEDQRSLDLSPNEDDTRAAVDRLRHWLGERGRGDDREALVALHELLAGSPARLVAATLEDLAAVAERPNMPGTIDAWPNWSIGLPAPLEDVLGSDLAIAVRAALADRARP